MNSTIILIVITMVLMILVIVVLLHFFIVMWLMLHPVMFFLYHLCTTHKVFSVGCLLIGSIFELRNDYDIFNKTSLILIYFNN